MSLAGMLEMSTMYLPSNKNWFKFIKNCENAYKDSEYILKHTLTKTANEACEFINHKE
jgi:DNA polymerase gamma 1